MTKTKPAMSPHPAGQAALQAIVDGRHSDAFSVLGPHQVNGARYVTAFAPDAAELAALTADGTNPLSPILGSSGLFFGAVPGDAPYWFSAATAQGHTWTYQDPYAFGPVLGDMDEYLFNEGTHHRLWEVLGAHIIRHQGQDGTHFAVWAPNAQRVSVVGLFNGWDGRRHPMRKRGSTGVWEIFMPGLSEGTVYKYEIVGAFGDVLPLKADPVGFGSEHPPANGSVIRDIRGYGWSDQAWMEDRAARNDREAPISIYEVHLGSWRRKEGGRAISYREAAEELVAYVVDMGFTHIELLPVSEYPFDGSWGYQPVGLFAPTIRHGPPHEFRDLVNAAHKAGLGIILDWVPGHFPTDAHGLGQFDGTALYEHTDPKEGFHQDWNTLIYNYGRTEVANFLVSNALYWLEEYHVDGLRVDAVASMLYRDYSRAAGEWVPNKDGGRENYEAIEMLQRMNIAAYSSSPGILTAAEESTSYPAVSAPVDHGGLGFGYKWNMGWMNDTLSYMEKDPVYRQHHHHDMTFGLIYAFSENFILPISHDEVVHGKGSMLQKMPGLEGDKYANLRAYYGFMWGHPGKKLLFMGQEIAQRHEWDHNAQVDWDALNDPRHAGVQRLIRDLNTLYRAEPALHTSDAHPDGFQWIEANDAANSVYVWLRRAKSEAPNVIVLCNFTPVERSAYPVGLPRPGRWREAINTDAEIYGGLGRGNLGHIVARETPSHGQPNSAEVYLPPLSTVILVAEPNE